jgi:hypothetical protein
MIEMREKREGRKRTAEAGFGESVSISMSKRTKPLPSDPTAW